MRKKAEAGLLDLLQEQQITNVRVESLDKQMIEVKTEIKGMKSEILDMNSEIKEMKSDIKEMNFRLGNVEGQLSTVTKIAIINQDAMDRFENRILKLESEVFKKSA